MHHKYQIGDYVKYGNYLCRVAKQETIGSVPVYNLWNLEIGVTIEHAKEWFMEYYPGYPRVEYTPEIETTKPINPNWWE